MVANHVQLYQDLLCPETAAVEEIREAARGPKVAIGRTPVLRPRRSRATTVVADAAVANRRLN
jgi:hypothetical protein